MTKIQQFLKQHKGKSLLGSVLFIVSLLGYSSVDINVYVTLKPAVSETVEEFKELTFKVFNVDPTEASK